MSFNSSSGYSDNLNSSNNSYEKTYEDDNESSSSRSRSLSPSSTSSSSTNLASTIESRKEDFIKRIEKNSSYYEKPDDDTLKFREEIKCRKSSIENNEPNSYKLKRNIKKSSNIFKNINSMDPTKMEEFYSKITGEDIISAICKSNITAIIFCYSGDKLKKEYRDENNNNYLHFGVYNDNIITMKTLLLLIDDSIDLLTENNNDNKCPFDLVKSDEMRNILLEFTSQRKTFSEMEPDQIFRISMIGQLTRKKVENINKDSKIFISLDGGGIRGLCTVQILMAIQKRMDNNLWDNVDWVIGTSTGGILALLLSLNYKLHEVRKVYLKLKNEVFQRITFSPYDSQKIEKLLIDLMGEFDTMDKIKDKKIAITTVKHKNHSGKSYFKLFRNYQLTEFNNNDKKNIGEPKYFNENYGYNNPSHNYIWKVARCTSAAPYFFHPFGEFLDGGLFSNNPSIDLLTDYFKYSHLESLNRNEEISTKINDDVCCFISLGTGAKQEGIPKVIENELEDVFTDEKMCLHNTYKICTQATSIFCKALEPDGLPVEKTSSWCNSLGIPFFRIQPNLSKDYRLDERKDYEIINMLWETQCHLNDVQYYEIETIARYLDTIIDIRKLLQQENFNNQQK